MSLPFKRIGAVGGLIDLGEQVEDRRLAGTVRADEAGDLGATDGHIEVVDRFQTAERDAEVDALEHGGLVRVALGEQRRFTGDGNELGCFLSVSWSILLFSTGAVMGQKSLEERLGLRSCWLRA